MSIDKAVIASAEIGLLQTLKQHFPKAKNSWYFIGDQFSESRALRSYYRIGVQVPADQRCYDVSHITITINGIGIYTLAPRDPSKKWDGLTFRLPSSLILDVVECLKVPLQDPHVFEKIAKVLRRTSKSWRLQPELDEKRVMKAARRNRTATDKALIKRIMRAPETRIFTIPV